MTSRFFILLSAALFACSDSNAAIATAPSAPRWDPDETAPTVQSVASASARARATHCRTSSCQAIIAIQTLSDILHYQFGNENGANEHIGNRLPVAGRRLDRTLLNHPELCGPVCATGAKLITRVQPDGEIFIPVMLLMNAVDIDLRDHGHCARDLVAALPRNPGNDEIRINARDLCMNDNENHHRPKTACAVLVEGVNEKQQ